MLKKIESLLPSHTEESGFDTITIKNLWEVDKFDQKATDILTVYKKDGNNKHLLDLASIVVERIRIMKKEGVQTQKGGEARGGAFFQGFLEKMLIRGVIHHDVLTHPVFITKIREELGEKGLKERILGALSVLQVVLDLKRDSKCVFIGSNIDFDTMMSTDLVAGYSEAGETENPYLDRVEFIQVKTGYLDNEEEDRIFIKHTELVSRFDATLDQATKTDFEKKQEGIAKEEGIFLQYAEKQEYVFKTLIEIEKMAKIEDFIDLAENLQQLPVELYYVITGENFVRTAEFLYAHDETQVMQFQNLREKVLSFKFPTRDLLDYRKLTNPNYVSVAGAGSYQSVIMKEMHKLPGKRICKEISNVL